MIALMLYPLIGHGVVLPTDATDDAGVLQNGSVRPLILVADFDESRTVRSVAFSINELRYVAEMAWKRSTREGSDGDVPLAYINDPKTFRTVLQHPKSTSV